VFVVFELIIKKIIIISTISPQSNVNKFLIIAFLIIKKKIVFCAFHISHLTYLRNEIITAKRKKKKTNSASIPRCSTVNKLRYVNCG
jgi:hypothetical protein